MNGLWVTKSHPPKIHFFFYSPSSSVYLYTVVTYGWFFTMHFQFCIFLLSIGSGREVLSMWLGAKCHLEVESKKQRALRQPGLPSRDCSPLAVKATHFYYSMPAIRAFWDSRNLSWRKLLLYSGQESSTFCTLSHGLCTNPLWKADLILISIR